MGVYDTVGKAVVGGAIGAVSGGVGTGTGSGLQPVDGVGPNIGQSISGNFGSIIGGAWTGTVVGARYGRIGGIYGSIAGGIVGGFIGTFTYGYLNNHPEVVAKINKNLSHLYPYFDSPTANIGHAIMFFGPQCFPCGTKIFLPDEDSIEIENIQVGMKVAAFDPQIRALDAPLASAEVVRVFRGVTTEWLKLSNNMIVTAGHLFFNEAGDFEEIGCLVARGGQIVRADGVLERVTAERIVYSEETRHLYEEAEELVYSSCGGVALAPEIKRGWRKYNFEVKGLHTYIAEGYKVHNDSTIVGDLAAGVVNGVAPIALGTAALVEDVAVTTVAVAIDLSRFNVVGAVQDAVTGAVVAAVVAFKSVGWAVQGVAGGVGGAFGVAANDISGITTGIANEIGGPIGGAIGAIGGVISGSIGGIGAVLSGIGSGQPVANTISDRAPAVGAPNGGPYSSATDAGFRDAAGFYHNTYDQAVAANQAASFNPWLAPDRNTGLDRFNPAGSNPAATDGGGLARALGFSGPTNSSGSSSGVGSGSSHGGSSSSTGGGNQGPSGNPGDRQDGDGSRTSGRGSAGSQGSGEPVILNLDGKGLGVTSLSSSTQFIDLNGDGYLHRTAWASAGNGVLVLDLDGDGKISQKNEYVFTDWDPSASSDLQALKDVFDTNHNGKLDAGDANWSNFKVMVNGQLVTLDSLGITSIDLTPTGSGQTFNDGSVITGTTTYTKSDGSTGQVGDASLATDTIGYVIRQTQTTNADGSVTTDILGYNADGSEAFENVVTVSANGANKTTKYDVNGDGVFDRSQTDNLVTNGDGSSTETISDFNADGSLKDRTATTTSADTKTVTTQVDQSGDGIWDQSQIFVTNADHSTSTTTKNLAANGSVINQTQVTTSADGLTKTTKSDHSGLGTFDQIKTDVTVINADGSRVETVSMTGANATLLSKSVTTTSADGRTKTVQVDNSGSGTFDLVTASTITVNADKSVSTAVTDKNADGSVRDQTTTTISADGLSKTVSKDINGDGTVDRVSTDITVIAADGARTETVSDKSGSGTLISKSVTATSADRKTITTTIDANGDGNTDQTTSILVAADGSTTKTVSNFAANGTLINHALTTTSASGLSKTAKTDLNGDGTYDTVETDVTVKNADGSSTETVTDTSANGTLVGKSIINTTANGLTQIKYQDLDGRPGFVDVFERTTRDAIVLNADGSRTETLTVVSNSGALLSKSVTTDSADRMTSTINVDNNGDGHIDQTQVSTTNTDGSTTRTLSEFAANGSLVDKTLTTVSANGLSTTIQSDLTGDGVYDGSTSDAIVLNTDGSKAETIANYSGSGALQSKQVVTTSGNGLSVTTQIDANGDGSFDAKTTDVTVINANGSRTETVLNYNGAGTTLLNRSVTTVSGNGLSKTTTSDFNGDGTIDQTISDVTTLNADGSRQRTVNTMNANGAVVGQVVTDTSAAGDRVESWAIPYVGSDTRTHEYKSIKADGSVQDDVWTYTADGSTVLSDVTTITSANGLSKTVITSLAGVIDSEQTSVTTINADGSRTTTVSDYAGTSTLKNKTVTTTSANGLTVTTQMDDNGDGSFERTNTSVKTLNADGSVTTVVSDVNANNSLHDKMTTTVSADQLTTTVTKDINGDATVDQTIVAHVNADGSIQTSSMDGTVKSASGRSYGGTRGRYETDSANGLTKTIQYDANGDGLAESQTTDVMVINADGSTVETITDASLSGGVATSASPTYTVTTKDKAVITTSADGLTVTRQYDLTGSGTFGATETDQTVLNADGSKTETVTETKAGVQTGRYVATTSGNGLSISKQWYFGTATNPSQTQTDVTTVNADGSTTETITSLKADGSLLSKTVKTTSADGRTVTLQQDPNGIGAFTQSSTTTTMTAIDAPLTSTYRDFNADGSLKDKITRQISTDGLTTTTSRDANGDGIVDQTEVVTKSVDGGSTDAITDFSSTGAKIDQMTATTSWDGLTTNMSWDFNADGVNDRTRADTKVYNADGSYSETIKDYRTSTKTNTGWGAAITPDLVKSTTIKISADGKTHTTTVDVDGNSSVDQTVTAVSKIDGSVIITTTNNDAAKAVAPLPGKVLWSSVRATSDKTVASSTITTVSADGLSKAVQADYGGNGTYEHTETWQTQIDGSQVGTIQDVDPAGAVSAKGTETISADGLTTTLREDSDNNGTIDHIDMAVTHADGSITETVTDYNPDGTLKQTLVRKVSANGQLYDDTLTGGVGNDTLTAGAGNDVLDGAAGDDVLKGGYGNDILVSGAGADSIDGGGGIDTLTFEGSQSGVSMALLTYYGGPTANWNKPATGDAVGDTYAGIEIIKGSAFDDNILASNADDTIYGGAGNDVLSGYQGNDIIDGGLGADKMAGGLGDDVFYVDDVGDTIVEYTTETWVSPTGNVFYYAGGTDEVRTSLTSYTLGTAIENLTLLDGGVAGTGNTLANKLVGNEAANTLSGLAGNDILSGGGGNDILDGGDGVDTLEGGAGADTLTGGVGVDTFVFKPAFGNDTISDFTASGTGADQINIDHNVFADWAALLSHTTQSGADTIITADANDVITLKNTTVSSLQQSNFHFT
ncbi:hypothetical protein [Labrys sp. (in: a-proteobacteria)]|uniref:hypothetical protein n=1 Tax=Labrys sp. (in: a-proteobacteria) TaxID=1917972 RepID=UPI0039E6DD59